MDFDEDKPYFEEHIGDHGEQKRQDLWEVAFGMQKTDGLSPSEKMIALAKAHIKGQLDYQGIYQEITDYYKEAGKEEAPRSDEADIASIRIVEILSSNAFSLTPSILAHYHKKLFEGIASFRFPVGKYRTVNMSKPEPVLSRRSVQYQDYNLIGTTLDWDFAQEKQFDYKGLSHQEVARHAMQFISGLWQIHPFREGNTRAIAVFTIQYLRSFGFEVNNEPFKHYAQYFRDSLALANDLTFYKTDKYLMRFTDNLLFGKAHILTRKNILVDQLYSESDEQNDYLLKGLKALSTRELEQAYAMNKEGKIQLFNMIIQTYTPNAFYQRLEKAQKLKDDGPDDQPQQNKTR